MRYQLTSFASSLTNYSKLKKVELEGLVPCRPTGTSFARCKGRWRAVCRSILSSRARYTEYVAAHSSSEIAADKIQVQQQPAIKHRFNMKKKKKPIIQVEDKFELLKILYLSIEIICDHGQHRVLLALLMQLAGITSNWLSALLGIRYNDVKITLLSDPQGGKFPRRLIEIAFKNSKEYLEEKETFVFLSVALLSYRVIWLNY